MKLKWAARVILVSATTAAVVLVIAFVVQTQRAQTPIAPPALTVVPPGPSAAAITEREPVDLNNLRPKELQQRDAVLARETLEQTIAEVRATARTFNELCDTIDKRIAAEVDYYAERSRIQTGRESEAARIQLYGIQERKAHNEECLETMKPMVDAERALLAMAKTRVWEDDASRLDLWNRLRESQGQMRKAQVDMQRAVEKLATLSGGR